MPRPSDWPALPQREPLTYPAGRPRGRWGFRESWDLVAAVHFLGQLSLRISDRLWALGSEQKCVLGACFVRCELAPHGGSCVWGPGILNPSTLPTTHARTHTQFTPMREHTHRHVHTHTYACTHTVHTTYTHTSHTHTHKHPYTHMHAHSRQELRASPAIGVFFKKEITCLFFLNFPRWGIRNAGEAQSAVQSPVLHGHPAPRPATLPPSPPKPWVPCLSEMSRDVRLSCFRSRRRGGASGHVCLLSGLTLEEPPFWLRPGVPCSDTLGGGEGARFQPWLILVLLRLQICSSLMRAVCF